MSSLCSKGQEAIWYETMFSKRPATYNIPLAVRFISGADSAAIAEGIRRVFKRNDIFMTKYLLTDSGLSGIVDTAGNLSIEFEPQPLNRRRMNSRLSSLSGIPFDLQNEFPIRCRILSDAQDRPVMFLLLSHIVFDLRTMSLFMRELLGELSGRGAAERPAGEDFQEFCKWQKNYLQSPEYQASLRFWSDHLKGYAPPPSPHKKDEQTHTLPAKMIVENCSRGTAILKAAEELSLSPARFFMTAHFAALRSIMPGEELLTGLVVGGRPPGRFRDTYGLFVNTVPLRHKQSTEESLFELAAAIKKELKSVLPHQLVPTGAIVNMIPERKYGRYAVFDSIFNYRHSGDDELDGVGQLQNIDRVVLESRGLKFESILVSRPASPAPLSVSIDRLGADFRVSVQYYPSDCPDSAVSQYLDNFKRAVTALTQKRNLPISEFSGPFVWGNEPEPYQTLRLPLTSTSSGNGAWQLTNEFRLRAGQDISLPERKRFIALAGILLSGYAGGGHGIIKAGYRGNFAWYHVPTDGDKTFSEAEKEMLELPAKMLSKAGGKDTSFALSFSPTVSKRAADLVLFIYPRDKVIYIRAGFSSGKVHPDFAANLCTNYSHLHKQTACASTQLKALSFVTDQEARHLVKLSGTKSEYQAKNIFSAFTAITKASPNRLAFTDEKNLYTYKDLHTAAAKVTAMLLSKGIREKEPVALMLEHSVGELAAILGILGAGGCYVPVDAKTPPERRDYILKAAGARFIFLPEKSTCQPIGGTAEALSVKEAESFLPASKHRSKMRGEDPAYIMFTSGTTGKPKGILIPQNAVLRLVLNTNYIRIKPSDRLLVTSSPAFDASTFEIWGALLNGAALISVPQDKFLDPALLAKVIADQGVTIMWLTAPLFTHIALTAPKTFRKLRVLLAGGDILPPKAVNLVQKNNLGLQIINGYGPTENTTFTACHRIPRGEHKSIPIGTPVSNTYVYILDEFGRLLPAGAFGELCISGEGLASGYINDSALTAEKFFPSPLAFSGKLYKSGDIARWNMSGVLEFAGRKDGQVKIRGYRIELQDIILAMTDFPGVVRAAALIKKGANTEKYIWGYLEMKPGVKCSAGEMRSFLAAKLPEYMLPASYIFLDALPLNKNGKIDTTALLALKSGTEPPPAVSASICVEMEDALRKIWAKVLSPATPGVHDDFFKIGGHSIKAAAITSRIRAELHLETDVSELYANSTIAKLAKSLCSARHSVKELRAATEAPVFPQSADKPAGPVDLPVNDMEEIIWQTFSKLLRRSDFGTHEDFFQLGGNSLQAVSLASTIRSLFSTDLKVSSVYEGATVSRLASLTASLPQLPRQALIRKGLNNVKKVRASHSQKRLWTSELLAPGSAAYNVPAAALLSGKLNAKILSRALDKLVARHWALRSGLTASPGGAVYQFDSGVKKASLVIKRCSLLEALAQVEADIAVPFNLSKPPLFRFRLFRISQRKNLFYFNMHHAITDGASNAVFIRELTQLYNNLLSGHSPRLPQLSHSYADYSAAQQRMISGGLASQRAYWLETLSGHISRTEFPPDQPDAPRPAYSGGREDIEIDPSLWGEIRSFCSESSVTPFVFFHACLGALVHRRTATQDAVINIFAAGRTDTRFDGVAGFFVNTLPLRSRLKKELSFLSLLKDSNSVIAEGLSNQDYPFDLIIDDLRAPRLLGQTPLSGVMFVFQNNENLFSSCSFRGIRAERVQLKLKSPKFDVLFSVADAPGRPGCMQVACEYSTPRYSADTIKGILRDYSQIIRQAIKTPHIQLKEFRLTPQGRCLRAGTALPSELAPTRSASAQNQLISNQLISIWAEVLGTGDIEPDSNFFSLGGHSLKAVEIALRANKEFSVSLTAGHIFENPTIRQLSIVVADLSGSGGQGRAKAIRKSVNLTTSHNQERRILAYERMEFVQPFPDYIGLTLLITGGLNAAVFCQAFDSVIGAHDIFRTFFHKSGERWLPAVELPSEKFRLRLETGLTRPPNLPARKYAQELAIKLRAKGFDPRVPPLFRAALYNTAPEEYVFSFWAEHVIFDRESCRILTGEIFTYYSRLLRGETVPASIGKLQYFDYSAWQRNELAGERRERLLGHWLNKFTPAFTKFCLKYDFTPGENSKASARLSWSAPPKLLSQVRETARRNGHTLFSVMLTALGLAARKMSGGMENLYFLTSFSGRTSPELTDMIGYLNNTLPLCLQLPDAIKLSDALSYASSEVSQAIEFQDLPVFMLLQALDAKPKGTIFLTYIPRGARDCPQVPGIDIINIGLGDHAASISHDLCVSISENDEDLTVLFLYRTDLFEMDTIKGFTNFFESALCALVKAPETTIARFMTSTSEREAK